MDRQFLIGKRIYLRPLEIEDISEKYLHWVNDYDVVQGRVDITVPITRDKQIKYVKSNLERDNVALFAIIVKASGRFIGTAKFGPIDWVHRFAEHATMIGDKKSWNKGYGREVILLLLEYGFRILNMHKIYAGIVADNLASIRKNEKVGYKTEAIFKDKFFIKGRYVDHLVMSLSQDEFFKLYPESILDRHIRPNKAKTTKVISLVSNKKI